MSWIVLIVAGFLEAVWATALAESRGLRRWRPALLFFAAGTLSMCGLAWAMREIPTGTAYAVWTGIGAAATVALAAARGIERLTLARTLLLILLVGCVIGLKMVS